MKKIVIVDIAEDSSYVLKRGVDGSSFFEIKTASLGVSYPEGLENKYQLIKTKLSIGRCLPGFFQGAYSGQEPFAIFLPDDLAFENAVNRNTLILDESEEIKKLFLWENRLNFFGHIKGMSFLPLSEEEKDPHKVRWILRKFWDGEEQA